MSNETSTKKEDIMPDISDADIEAILSASADEEEKADDASDELLEAALQEVELETSKIDAYEEQDKKSEPEPDPVPEEIVEEEAKKAAKPKRKRKAKAKTAAKPAAPAPEPIPAGTNPSDILHRKLGKKVYEICVTSTDKADKADVDALLERLDKEMPVKVKDKIVNLFLFLDGQAELSVFSRLIFEAIEANDGSLAFNDIKRIYMERPYTKGTAGAHASHFKWIFDLTGMCDRKAGYVFTVNPESVLWPVMCAAMKNKPVKAAEEESEAA